MRLVCAWFGVTLLLLAAGCDGQAKKSPSYASSPKSALPRPETFAATHTRFNTYWYQGKAELTRYALSQARYGDLHEGEAVLIFVTEDFLPDVQVKLERGESDDAVSVLKLNAYRRFSTGIYPYTLMTSSFTPARPKAAPTLKLSTTVQEWCGQTYTQINRRDDGLHAVMHSYFQGEADQKMTLPDAALEDGLWAQIRIDPAAIELGQQEIVPGIDYIRMRHKALRAYPAVVSRRSGMKTDLLDAPTDALIVDYPPLARKLIIYYDAAFPHVIHAWEESVGPQRTTAVRTHAIVDNYWDHSSPEDASYRDALGLMY